MSNEQYLAGYNQALLDASKTCKVVKQQMNDTFKQETVIQKEFVKIANSLINVAEKAILKLEPNILP